jgi:hypothetical protein
MRLMVRGLADVSSIAELTDKKLGDLGYLDRNCEAHWNDVVRLVRGAFDRFRGVAPLDRPVWELGDLGLRSRTQSGVRAASRRLDVTQIRQEWLRRLLADWVKETTPDNNDFRRTFEGCLSASRALSARPGGGHDPGALKVTDMDAVVAAIRDRKRQDGTATLSYGSRAELLAHFCKLLDFGRRLQILGHVASVFARHPHHKIPYEDPAEDMAGKAIPEGVVAQLDAQIHLIGVDFAYGDMAPEVVQAMLCTVYVLLRDTGRRPWEVRWLRMDCLEAQDGEYILIWDNHKARRRMPSPHRTPPLPRPLRHHTINRTSEKDAGPWHAVRAGRHVLAEACAAARDTGPARRPRRCGRSWCRTTAATRQAACAGAPPTTAACRPPRRRSSPPTTPRRAMSVTGTSSDGRGSPRMSPRRVSPAAPT